MPTLVYNITSKKNTGLLFSPAQLEARYFHGIALQDPAGNPIQEETMEFYIRAAQAEFEGYLNLKLNKQVIEETGSYYRGDYAQHGHLEVSYPVNKAFSLTGFMGKIEAIKFPEGWLSIAKSNDDFAANRTINIVPTSNETPQHSATVAYSGLSANLHYLGNKSIPNYWTATYCTSFNRIPEDIVDAVGKLASLNLFHVLGDILIGAGIASSSIGIDGLSQSISTTSSATSAGFGSRVHAYLAELKRALPMLKAKYDSINLMGL